MTLIDILLVILLLMSSVLVVYLIYVLKNLNSNLDKLQNSIDDVNDRLLPILDNFNEVSQKALSITSDVELKYDKTVNFINDYKSKITSLSSLSQSSNTANRVTNLVHNLSAFAKGVSAFLKELKKNY